MPNTSNHSLYALALVAHPDDESFLMAGTSLKFAEEGKTVGVVCATRGEKGADRLQRNLSEPEMADLRSKELVTACEIIKCACVEFFEYPDGSLDQINFDGLVEDLVEKIDEYRPEIILTFGKEGISGHRDHKIIGKAAIAATKKSLHRPKEIWLASMPASMIGHFNEHQQQRRIHHSHFQEQLLEGVPDEQLMVVDVAKYAEEKQQALQAHASQYLNNSVFKMFLTHEYFEIIKI